MRAHTKAHSRTDTRRSWTLPQTLTDPAHAHANRSKTTATVNHVPVGTHTHTHTHTHAHTRTHTHAHTRIGMRTRTSANALVLRDIQGIRVCAIASAIYPTAERPRHRRRSEMRAGACERESLCVGTDMRLLLQREQATACEQVHAEVPEGTRHNHLNPLITPASTPPSTP
jgi:hypothetical protein